MKEQYEALRALLQYDIRCHEQMADFQEMFQEGQPEDYASIRFRFQQFSKDVGSMIDGLEAMNPGVYSDLKAYHRKFDFYIRFLLEPPKVTSTPPYVLPVDELDAEILVGNKSRHLGILRNLGILTPPAVAVTVNGFNYFIEANDLRKRIDELLASISIKSPQSLSDASYLLMELIRRASVPKELELAIVSGCKPLFADSSVTVAVRSSGVGEDGESSFAGQFTSVLHVEQGGLLDAYKEVLASKYSPEALYYRIHQGWNDEETGMSVLIMPMVNAKFSGVLYTGDIIGNSESDHMSLHVVKGLGEQLVSGRAVADTCLISKSKPYSIYPEPEGQLPKESIIELADYGLLIENEFSSPQDIEWAVDENGTVFILQARALHQSIEGQETVEKKVSIEFKENLLIQDCERCSAGVAAGNVSILRDIHSLDLIPEDAILVTETTPPELVKSIHKFSGVLSVRGSRASHFATVAREFGVPFLSGISHCFELVEDGDLITVDGNSGKVYTGKIDELLITSERPGYGEKYHRIVTEAAKFITSLDLVDPAAKNFTPEGCRSMHDIIRFCHEKALQTLFSVGKPGSGRGSRKLKGEIPLDVYLFDVGGGISEDIDSDPKDKNVPLSAVVSAPFQALWRGLSHPDVQWNQKPFDWDAYERIELSGGVPPKQDSFAFASYAVVGSDYLHFNLRFGYHFTIVDVICGEKSAENHCMLRFAGGGADFDHRSLRINFLDSILKRLGFIVDLKGDLLEAKILGCEQNELNNTLDMLGRLLGATKLMDMVLDNDEMVQDCVEEFFRGRYSFSEKG